MAYEITFSSPDDWEIVLPSDADVYDLAALGEVVQAVRSFAVPLGDVIHRSA